LCQFSLFHSLSHPCPLLPRGLLTPARLRERPFVRVTRPLSFLPSLKYSIPATATCGRPPPSLIGFQGALVLMCRLCPFFLVRQVLVLRLRINMTRFRIAIQIGHGFLPVPCFASYVPCREPILRLCTLRYFRPRLPPSQCEGFSERTSAFRSLFFSQGGPLMISVSFVMWRTWHFSAAKEFLVA